MQSTEQSRFIRTHSAASRVIYEAGSLNMVKEQALKFGLTWSMSNKSIKNVTLVQNKACYSIPTAAQLNLYPVLTSSTRLILYCILKQFIFLPTQVHTDSSGNLSENRTRHGCREQLAQITRNTPNHLHVQPI